MHDILFISVLLLGFGFGFGSEGSCPKFIVCESSATEESCPQGEFYREKIKVHGCCPGCVSLKGVNEPCTSPAECQPGLTCAGEKCVGDPSQGCEFYKRFDDMFKKTKYWKPLCLQDGTYAAKQCKGEKMAGKCFCANGAGGRIFGEEEWSRAENMTCACSHLTEALKSRGRKNSLHCDRLGNFEPLQCEGKVCWCSHPTSGIPYTVVVPLEMVTSLPCYDRGAVGAQYHRQCDSANHLQEMAESLLRNHGTTGIVLPSQKCNLDGSYHRVQIVKEKKRCVYVNNSPLTEAVESQEANCNCAYDKHVAQSNQISFLADCLPNGNYRRRQVCDGKVYCVDRDGFHYSYDPDDCPPHLYT